MLGLSFSQLRDAFHLISFSSAVSCSRSNWWRCCNEGDLDLFYRCFWGTWMESDSLLKQMSDRCCGQLLADRPTDELAVRIRVHTWTSVEGWGSHPQRGLGLGHVARPDLTLPALVSPQQISSAFLRFISAPRSANIWAGKIQSSKAETVVDFLLNRPAEDQWKLA